MGELLGTAEAILPISPTWSLLQASGAFHHSETLCRRKAAGENVKDEMKMSQLCLLAALLIGWFVRLFSQQALKLDSA